MDLSEMRTRVRRDLHDEDPANQRWTDDELDRHIERVVRELSLAIPLEAKATLTTSEGSRDISLASLSDLVAVEAAEYPGDMYPPSYVPFSLWASTLTLLWVRKDSPRSSTRRPARPRRAGPGGKRRPRPPRRGCRVQRRNRGGTGQTRGRVPQK